jgi:hypothetical protein
MSETKWTPGPWRHEDGEWGTVVDAPSGNVCALASVPRSRRVADAHLIAAAPDIYEALDALFEDWSVGAQTWPQLRNRLDPLFARAGSALAKARGTP